MVAPALHTVLGSAGISIRRQLLSSDVVPVSRTGTGVTVSLRDLLRLAYEYTKKVMYIYIYMRKIYVCIVRECFFV